MDIFNAISDPTRRDIIERLHQHGPQSIKALHSGMSISRQALTKHLDKLIKARIVSADYVGKERIHTLNPKPVESLARWLLPFSQNWEQRLNNLSEYLGDDDDKN